MSISDSNNCYLELLNDIYEISKKLKTKIYIWGGFTTDIFEGEFLREHGDLDGFVENMMGILNQLSTEFMNKGYHVEFNGNFNMLTVRRGDQHAGFNPLDIDGELAMWRHIGDHGTVYFPYSWLDKTPRKFYDTSVYTSGLSFEYALRYNIHDMNPEWKEREKDKIAKEYLLNKLKENNIEPADILDKMWSYNPLWIRKGYSPFDKPTLVCPRKQN